MFSPPRLLPYLWAALLGLGGAGVVLLTAQGGRLWVRGLTAALVGVAIAALVLSPRFADLVYGLRDGARRR